LQKYFGRQMSIQGGQQGRRTKIWCARTVPTDKYVVLGGRMDRRILMPR
jgi:hypothetical protein